MYRQDSGWLSARCARWPACRDRPVEGSARRVRGRGVRLVVVDGLEGLPVRRIFDKQVPKYDRSMPRFERVFFSGNREWACSQPIGDVLEIPLARPETVSIIRME